MTIKFALLGAGRIGQVHARAISLNPLASLWAVCDISEIAAQKVCTDFGGTLMSVDKIADTAEIDAVMICTPTNTHADLIEKFSYAGKAVFCEKPVDLDIKRVGHCLDIVDQHSTRLMVGFNRRFDPHFAALKDAILAGSIGNIEMINIISRDPVAPPKDYIKVSGGIFRDMTIHDFDMARFLMEEEFETVMASASVLVDPGIGELGDYDSVNVILTTASGRQCSISNSRRATYGYDQRIEVHGSVGLVRAENQRPVSIEVASKCGYLRPPLHDFFMTRYEQAYCTEISVFIEMLANNMPVSPDGHDGLAALALAEAAEMSVNQKRVVFVKEVF